MRLLPTSLAGALVCVGLSLVAVPAEASGTCYVTASSATIRSAPTSASTALGVAYRGSRCKERDRRGGWIKVAITNGGAKGRTGWVRDDLLHTSADDVRTCIPEDVACHG